MRRVLLLLTASLVLVISAFAQERTVTGKVTSAEDGSALPGVNVVLKGTTAGTVTDVEGNYKISVPAEGGTLVFSFIGLTTSEIGIGSRQTVDVQMAADVQQLSEVVVVGYGTTLKKDLTGSIASLSGKDIQNLPTASPDQALQGLASGVFVTSNSGAPGGGISVRIRGQNSISGSNTPLYVIDGVVIQSGEINQSDFGGQNDNPLSAINPQDIESIQVLKDASSTAIYGARAANGVVLIATKRGKSGGNKVEIGAWTGFGESVKLPELVSAQEWVDMKNEAYINDNPGSSPQPNSFWGWDGVTNTNWINEVFRVSRISQYQVSSSGGDNKFTYYISGSYRDEEGAIIGSGFNRLTGRVNLDYTASEKFRLGTSLNISSQLSQRIQNDNNIYGIFSASILTPPTRPVRNEEGEFVDALPSFNTNPVRDALEPRYDNTTNKLIGNLYFTYNLLDGLDFRTDLSYDYTSLKEDHYEPVTTAQGRGTNGSGNFNTREVGTYIIEPTIRYSKTFSDLHKVQGVAGLTFQQTTDVSNFVTGTGFSRPSLTYVTSAATITDGSSFKEIYSFNSVFGRVNYSYNEKYIAEVSVRRDGSSRFGPDKRFGLFYAVSGAWNFSEESFMDGISFIETGKLRASFGVTGNDRIGNFTYIGSWTGGANYLDQPASAPDQIANNNLQWEETQKLDIGLELGLFNNRLNVNAGYFQSNTTQLLFNKPVPNTTGFATVSSNLGEVENKGIELDLSGVVLSRGDFRWSSTVNISFMQNKLIKLLDQDAPILQGFASAIIEGEPLNTFYGLKWLGVDPATGNSVLGY